MVKVRASRQTPLYVLYNTGAMYVLVYTPSVPNAKCISYSYGWLEREKKNHFSVVL